VTRPGSRIWLAAARRLPGALYRGIAGGTYSYCYWYSVVVRHRLLHDIFSQAQVRPEDAMLVLE
jgi:hypothetical protein